VFQVKAKQVKFILQGEYKVFPWLQTFITRKLVEYIFFLTIT